MYAFGSPTSNALQKWGWYVRAFLMTAVGDSLSLTMTPTEYLAEWEINPGMMAAFHVIQGSARKWNSKGLKDIEVKNGRVNRNA